MDPDERTKHRPRPGRTIRRRIAAARHSRAYRERPTANGVPTGAEIDAMIAGVLVRLACRRRELKTDATQMPKLCDVVAKQFLVADESREAFVDHVALRLAKMRAVAV